MSTDPEQLQQLWEGLRCPASGRLAGQRISGLPIDRPVYVAIDEQFGRHLLIGAAKEAAGWRPISTRALEVRYDSLIVAGAPETNFLVFRCRGTEFHEMFSAFSAELADRVVEQPDSAGAALALFQQWRRFWDVPSDALTIENALGLFGELWFLKRWLAPIDRHALDGWAGWDESLHDFQWPTASVEVKTSAARGGPLVHRIGRIEQLDPPSSGELFLFSLRITDDRLASNSLGALVDSIVGALGADSSAASDFLDRVATRGYVPVKSGLAGRTYRILSEGLYRIGPDFPRLSLGLLREPLPDAVKDVSYTLNLDPCSDWLVATNPMGARQRLGL